MDEVEIRLCKSWDDCLQCEELQKRIWEMPDYRDAVPANFLITAVKNGGILVGAFEGQEMVGFAFGFLGSERDLDAGDDSTWRLKHTSHMLGVLPSVRTRGLGARLKWLQRETALAQGLQLMTWTYDPLQAVNAHLNLARLGAIARRYLRDAYGDMTDALNVGVASDRFEVEWYLDGPRVQTLAAGDGASISSAGAQSLYTVEFTRSGFPKIVYEHPLEGELILVEIPADYNTMKKAEHPLAVEWRARSRDTFERAFAAGYAAVDVVYETDSEQPVRVRYVLQQDFI